MFSWEKKLVEWVHRHLLAIGAVLLLLFSAALRYVLVPFQSPDFTNGFYIWFCQLRDAGSVMEGMRQEIGGYNHLYRFLLSLLTWMPPIWGVKLLAMLFDYVGAAACAWLGYTALLQSGTEKRRAVAMACVSGLILLYLPIVLMNSAIWGQCDFMHVSFLIFCLVFLLKEKYVPAFICYGVAFSLKLQAVFLLPVLVLLYVLTKRFSFTNFLLIPATVWATGLPGIIARWPVSGAYALLEPFLIYKNQVVEFHDGFTFNFPNIYSLMDLAAMPEGRIYNYFNYVRLAGTMFALAVLGMALWYVLLKRPKMNARLLILLCVFSVDTCVLFLPLMHERYAFCATILLTLYVILYRRLGASLIAWYVTETCTYLFFLNQNPINFSYQTMAIVNLMAYAFVCIELHRLVCAASDTAPAVPQRRIAPKKGN